MNIEKIIKWQENSTYYSGYETLLNLSEIPQRVVGLQILEQLADAEAVVDGHEDVVWDWDEFVLIYDPVLNLEDDPSAADAYDQFGARLFSDIDTDSTEPLYCWSLVENEDDTESLVTGYLGWANGYMVSKKPWGSRGETVALEGGAYDG